MFTLGIRRKFESQHYLIGGNWGAENAPHSHDYELELRLEAQKLDHHGFLIDIEKINKQLDELLEKFQGVTLNALPEFEGINPSLERFSRILCASMAKRIRTENLRSIHLTLWESESAWASYRLEF